MKHLFALEILLLTQPAWGFDLTRHSVPIAAISSVLPKDAIPAVDGPRFIKGQEADYLAPQDRVVGLIMDGEARAYPLKVLNGHEIVNDEIRGRPIAVTW